MTEDTCSGRLDRTNSTESSGAVKQDRWANLDALRREIDAIDVQIVNLLAQRHDRVQQVVSIKKSMGLPVWHPAREEDLVSQRRAQAARVGLDPAFVEEIYRCVLRQSRVRQTSHVARVAVRPGYKVLIVGGRGRMGEYFGRWFRDAGYEVRVLEVEDWPRVDELCMGIQLALVSVPIDRTMDVIKKLGPHLPPDCVLADITSLKSGPVAAMLEAHKGPVVGLHPLFGPSTTVMDQQIVVSSPGRDPAACQWVLDQFSVWGNIVLTLEAQEHDELMDIMQGVRHFATFAFGRFLAERNISLSKTLEFCSPIYRLELAMVGRLFAQDARLYAGIILASQQRRDLLREFVSSLERSRKILEEGGMEAFCTEFERVADWFGTFCEQAMRESSFLIDKLVERF